MNGIVVDRKAAGKSRAEETTQGPLLLAKLALMQQSRRSLTHRDRASNEKNSPPLEIHAGYGPIETKSWLGQALVLSVMFSVVASLLALRLFVSWCAQESFADEDLPRSEIWRRMLWGLSFVDLLVSVRWNKKERKNKSLSLFALHMP